MIKDIIANLFKKVAVMNYFMASLFKKKVAVIG